MAPRTDGTATYADRVGHRRTAASAAAVLLGLCAGLLVSGLGGATASAAVGRAALTVRVDARDFSYTLSRSSVPVGTPVTFVVRNRGSAPHDFVIAGRRTRILPPGATASLRTTFTRRGQKAFLCSVPGHARLGMRGRFGVGAPAAASPPPPPPPPIVVAGSARLTEVGRFERPVHVTAPPGDDRRLFVVEQAGRVRVVEDGAVRQEPFLDLRDEVMLTSEPGLLSLAFAPDWATSRLAYVFYNQRKGNGDIRIAEVRARAANTSVADTATLRTVLEIVKPWENHNGGMLQFGPDGYLYASVGDGDSGVLNRPGAFAQSRDELLGNILRIDPRGGVPYAVPNDNPFVGEDGVRPEIWAYGLRNPWRFWIDHASRQTVIADVGLGRSEELDVVPAGAGGLNFGWPCFEGTLPQDPGARCAEAVPPALELGRENGSCSVIGGVVVHDPRLPALAGRYLFGDYCTGAIESVRLEGGTLVDRVPLRLVVPELSSFGVDGAGRVYVTSTGGAVYRLDPV